MKPDPGPPVPSNGRNRDEELTGEVNVSAWKLATGKFCRGMLRQIVLLKPSVATCHQDSPLLPRCCSRCFFSLTFLFLLSQVSWMANWQCRRRRTVILQGHHRLSIHLITSGVARLCKSKEGIIQLGEATSATDTSSIPSPSIDVPPLLVARQLDAIFHMSRFLQGPWIPWMGATHKTS